MKRIRLLLLDDHICLRDAGVIVNDNVAQCNGLLVVYPALVDKDERVTIEVVT